MFVGNSIVLARSTVDCETKPIRGFTDCETKPNLRRVTFLNEANLSGFCSNPRTYRIEAVQNRDSEGQCSGFADILPGTRFVQTNPILVKMNKESAKKSERVVHEFTTVLRVTDQFLTFRVHHPIH